MVFVIHFESYVECDKDAVSNTNTDIQMRYMWPRKLAYKNLGHDCEKLHTRGDVPFLENSQVSSDNLSSIIGLAEDKVIDLMKITTNCPLTKK